MRARSVRRLQCGERIAKQTEAKLPKRFRRRDQAAAIDAIRRVAATFDPHRGPGMLEGLTEARDMTPTHMRDQLRIHFGLRLPRAQLAALVAHFDQDGNGMIDSSEFMAEV